jgi:transcriptional regulator with XRE-family HTH domain
MITSAQLRAARVLLGMDQRQLADLSGLSVPTIQRMEASESMVRGNVDSLMKLIVAFDRAGIEMIDEGAASTGEGRGVRLTRRVESKKSLQDGGSDGNALPDGRKRSA